ncbi:hypothetical protein G1K75_12050 [Tenacibaculum finnmarkense]|uniref:hypothetical protein n=3 Tax=Tenacibaculum finnmarkense TaxID=2781243 RepID=UPI00187BBC5B|nr:hypothetical protein [Tenacibaculum finnmarkense]MBE7635101.1 hypothetical protein [Tenacibaculum finnmarkense genomovar ulcerans]MBE7649119.1 hypothetical protein [Tenacibaculum finnmarkense genomovar ulcerans]MCG8806383.1 hypothetical protein [Tenacibaculum finnmarkense]MCG8859969.1 hypothetical protein [Tenacibaculum finnmarkense]
MKVLKYMGYTIFGLIVFIVGFIYYLRIQRDTKINIENIEVAENISVSIELMHSQRKNYLGHFGGGNGDVKNSIKFKYKNIKYFHNVPFIPIVIKIYKEDFYLVYYDRETDIHNTTHRFYKSTKKGNFKEVKATEFPKHIAIQNRFWSSNKPEDLVGLKPEKLKTTKTAYLWYLIEDKPDKYNWDTREDFIKNYKEKYITNRKDKNE